MLLLSFQPLTLGAIELALCLLSILALVKFRIMPRGITHSRLPDIMVKRQTGAVDAPGTPPFGPTQRSPKLESSNSANSRRPRKIPCRTEKPSQRSSGHRGKSNGRKAASSNGDKAESSNHGHKGKSSGYSDDEHSRSSSESGLTELDSLSPLKHDTASSSSKSSNLDPRIGPLEKKCEKLILNDELTPPSKEVLLPPSSEVLLPPSSEVLLPPSSEVLLPPSSEVLLPPLSEELLPPECIHLILGRFKWRHAVKLRGKLGNNYRDFTSHPAFVQSRPKAEGEYSPITFMVDARDDLLWYGFNTKSRIWESLPSLNFAKHTVLPSPDPDLFKDYLVAGDGGLLCFNVGKSAGRESLVVCNPLSRQVKQLPPLKHPRHPVLMHYRMDEDGVNYKIVVAGSAATGTEDVSLKTEEYDSRTGEWVCPEGSDMPCQPFGLNEYQNGVQVGKFLLCGAIIDTRGRGILIYDLKKKTWLQDHRKLHIPLVRTPESNVAHLATSQLVECGGCVYVFSEQECGREFFFVIHKLNLDGLESNPWDQISCRKRVGGRGLLVYPEFTCSAVSGHELAIFNTVEHTMEIVDLNKSPSEVASLRSVPSSKANRFHSLNPIGFPYAPSFGSLVCPRGRHPKSRCTSDGLYCSECERTRKLDSGLIMPQPVPVEPPPAVPLNNIAPIEPHSVPVSRGGKMVPRVTRSGKKSRSGKKNTKRNGSDSLSGNVPLGCRS